MQIFGSKIRIINPLLTEVMPPPPPTHTPPKCTQQFFWASFVLQLRKFSWRHFHTRMHCVNKFQMKINQIWTVACACSLSVNDPEDIWSLSMKYISYLYPVAKSDRQFAVFCQRNVKSNNQKTQQSINQVKFTTCAAETARLFMRSGSRYCVSKGRSSKTQTYQRLLLTNTPRVATAQGKQGI